MIAFGAYRVPPREGASPSELAGRALEMLVRVLNIKRTVAVVGSGCSVPLGYPTWNTFAREAVEAVLEDLRQSPGSLPGQECDIRRLQDYLDQMTRIGSSESHSLMFYLGECQRIAKKKGQESNAFTDYVKTRFAKPSQERAAPSPAKALVALPISRFVTTNYDFELERALVEGRAADASCYDLPEAPAKGGLKEVLSFTQTKQWGEHQIRFALARGRANRNMVFHCHGRFDDAESIIASETDYQSWYVQAERTENVSFHQTMEVLFGSNPLLFVGYGLQDYDLMQILRRQLPAVDPNRKHSRPLFALLSSENSPRDHHRNALYYERYGLHVIPYDEDGGDRAEALCRALDRIGSEWKAAQDEWQRKPPVKGPFSHSDRSQNLCMVPKLSTVTMERLADVPRRSKLEQLP